MRRTVCVIIISILINMAWSAGAAQEQPPPSRPVSQLAENASLEETLSWLDAGLRRYGRFTLYYSVYEPGLRYRTRFLGLETGGCAVTYRISYERLGAGSVEVIPPTQNASNAPVDGAAKVEVRTVNLAALDPASVKGERPKKWDGGRIIFGAGKGKVAVTSRNQRGKLQEYEGGEFYVSEAGAVEVMAQALRQAVSLCRKKG